MDLTITPPPGYHKVNHGRWMWAKANCNRCGGTGLIWTKVWDRSINEYSPICEEDSNCECVWMPDTTVLEELNKQYFSWGNPDRARNSWAYIGRALGPRRVGGVYRSGYWGKNYTVIAINFWFPDGDPASPLWSVTVQWEDGRRATHYTRWDERRDSCLRQPTLNS